MRLFVALDMPWAVREQLAALSGSGIPGARWVPPGNFHLTLRFIGDIPGHVARDVDAGCTPVETPMTVRCDRCGKPMVVKRGLRGPFLGCRMVAGGRDDMVRPWDWQ